MRSVDADTMRRILSVSQDPLAEARLKFSEVESFRKYLSPLVGKERCHSSMLPTQASGRWSTTNPPKVNFPDDKKAEEYDLPELQSVFMPDPGYWWLGWDHDAIEARLGTAYCGDKLDLESFANGWDIHTLTACDLFTLPLPPSKLEQDIHSKSPTPTMAAWQAQVKWGGKGDRRRHLAKTARYALTYGEDEKACTTAKGVEKLGLSKQELLDAGRRFLRAKAKTLVIWKKITWAECIRTKMARTFLGRRRMLFGPDHHVKKEGLNHMIQGAVADVMNANLISLLGPGGMLEQWGTLELNAHDGARIALPVSIDLGILPYVRAIVEREWDVQGNRMRFPATFYWIDDQGVKAGL